MTLSQRDVCDDPLDVNPGLASCQANKDAWDDQQVVQSVNSPHQNIALQVPSYKKMTTLTRVLDKASWDSKLFSPLSWGLPQYSSNSYYFTFDLDQYFVLGCARVDGVTVAVP